MPYNNFGGGGGGQVWYYLRQYSVCVATDATLRIHDILAYIMQILVPILKCPCIVLPDS